MVPTVILSGAMDLLSCFLAAGKHRDVAGRVQVRDDTSETTGVRSTAVSGVCFFALGEGIVPLGSIARPFEI